MRGLVKDTKKLSLSNNNNNTASTSSSSKTMIKPTRTTSSSMSTNSRVLSKPSTNKVQSQTSTTKTVTGKSSTAVGKKQPPPPSSTPQSTQKTSTIAASSASSKNHNNNSTTIALPKASHANTSEEIAGGVQDKTSDTPAAPKNIGAVHSADIEYAMGTLPTNRVYDWQPEDYTISDIFSNYYVNFVKTGNPNGLGLVEWPTTNGKAIAPVLQIDANTFVKEDPNMEKRYEIMDQLFWK